MSDRKRWIEIAKRFSELTETELEDKKTQWVRGCDDNHAVLIAIDQKRQKAKEEDRDIVRQHHRDILGQNDRHHSEQLSQQEREFRYLIRATRIGALISVIAALAALAAAWYAREQNTLAAKSLLSSTTQQPTTPALPKEKPDETSLPKSKAPQLEQPETNATILENANSPAPAGQQK